MDSNKNLESFHASSNPLENDLDSNHGMEPIACPHLEPTPKRKLPSKNPPTPKKLLYRIVSQKYLYITLYVLVLLSVQAVELKVEIHTCWICMHAIESTEEYTKRVYTKLV